MRWSPWDQGLNGRKVFCNSINAYYNGTELPSIFRGQDFTDPNFCSFMSIRRSEFLPFQDRVNSDFFVSSSLWSNVYSFDTFAGLRVPKLHLSILPDQMLPGDYASPYVEESIVSDGVEDHLVLFVKVRESEADGGFMEIKVPVYAVDRNGDLMRANGFFKGEFEGIQSDCGDCVMVDGKAYITIKVPVFSSSNPGFDLSSVKLYGSADCDLDRSDQAYAADGFLYGCTTVTAEHKAPGNAPPEINTFPYEQTAEFFASLNKVSFGNTEKEREAFRANFLDVPVEVVKFGINFVPFYDLVDLGAQGLNYIRGQDVDVVLVVLSSGGVVLDLTTGGTLDVTAPIKAVYKFSQDAARRGVGGAMAQAIREIVENGIAAGKGAKAIIDDVWSVFGTAIKVTTDCGFRCLTQADKTVTDLVRASGETAPSAFKQLDNGLKDIRRADIPTGCFLRASSELAQAGFSIGSISLLFMGVVPSEAPSTERFDLSPLVIKSTAKCPYTQLNVNIRADPVNKARYDGIPTDSRGKPKGSSPHHIVPLKEFNDRRCNAGGSRNVCNEMRDLMSRYDIDLNDGDNGVFLPYTTTSPLRDKYPNATLHNRTDFHTLPYYTKVADDLKRVEEELLGLEPPKAATEIAKALRKELQTVAEKLLAGTYPK